MIVEALPPGGEQEWDAYLEAQPRATVYHLRAWAEVAERAYGMRAPLLVARAGGAVRGVLPLFVIGPPFGRHVANGLFGAYGEVLADDAEARAALLREAQQVTAESGSRYLILKTLGDEPPPEGFERRELGVVALLPLEPDPQAMWGRFRDKIRNSIRKAQKCGLELRVDRADVRAFYDVLAENYHRLGTPIYGFPVMRELLASLGDRAAVFTLRKDGRVVSGALVIWYKGVTYVPFCSSRPSAFHMNPNNLIYWEIIRHACERGMKALDFGRSPTDSSSLAFKLGWGATTVPQPYFIFTARGKPPQLDVAAPAVQRMVRLWRRLPRAVADALGPVIARRFLA